MKLIKITASWCMSCIIMNDTLDNVLKDVFLEDIISYDYDMDNNVIDKYHVGVVLPVYILVNNDREVRRIVGEKSRQELLEFFKGDD